MKRTVLRVLRRVDEPFMALTALALAGSVVISYAFALGPVYERDLTALAWFAYGVFAADFLVRLYAAHPRRRFLGQHWIDLAALLPLGLFIQSLRRYRAVRGFVMLRRYSEFFHAVFLRHGFAHIVAVTFGLVVAGAYAIHRVEPGIGSFGDALWWSFVTTTTVGYGDISPKTAAGRGVAVVLMLLGIGFIGLFTGTVATFFVERGTQRRQQGPLADLKAHLDRLEELSPQQFADLQASLAAIHAARTRDR
jgi:voltage-gated potassium channel